MAAAVRENMNIEGIQIYNKEQKLSLYADDAFLYLVAKDRI